MIPFPDDLDQANLYNTGYGILTAFSRPALAHGGTDAIAANTLKPEALKSPLRSCGYRPNLLRNDFEFGDDQTIPLIGFAQFPTDTRSACVAVLSETPEPRKAVEACRPIGAPLVFVCFPDSLQWPF